MGMETALNEIFALPIGEGRLDFLEQRNVMIEVLDVDARWVISFYRDRLLVLPGREDADVVISGDSAQFLALGLRNEDPDMFFFQRQLKVRGDTELGLAMKNFIDSVDEEDLPPLLRYVPKSFRRRLFS
jgi:predicted lipid carrier protein YhbT